MFILYQLAKLKIYPTKSSIHSFKFIKWNFPHVRKGQSPASSGSISMTFHFCLFRSLALLCHGEAAGWGCTAQLVSMFSSGRVSFHSRPVRITGKCQPWRTAPSASLQTGWRTRVPGPRSPAACVPDLFTFLKSHRRPSEQAWRLLWSLSYRWRKGTEIKIMAALCAGLAWQAIKLTGTGVTPRKVWNGCTLQPRMHQTSLTPFPSCSGRKHNNDLPYERHWFNMYQDSISLVALRCQAYKQNLHIISPFYRWRSHDTGKSISLCKITVSGG